MNARLIAVACSAVALSSLYAPETAATGSPLAPSIGIHLGAEHYSWEELDQSGTRLLREYGPRGSLELSLGNTNRRSSGLVYRLDGRAYYGDVVYDGQLTKTIAGVAHVEPAKGHTRYIGGRAELTGGYRIQLFDTFGLDLLASGGVDRWRRAIHNVRGSVSGDTGPNTTEIYRILYAKLGVGLYHAQGRWSQYVQFGAKRQINSREVALGHIFRPRGQASFYIRWEMNRLNENQDRTFSFALYYDSFAFKQSPSVFVGSQCDPTKYCVQPDSSQNIFGAQLGYYFNPF